MDELMKEEKTGITTDIVPLVLDAVDAVVMFSLTGEMICLIKELITEYPKCVELIL